MNDADRKRWSERLTQSDSLWAARGLTGQRGSARSVTGHYETFDLRHTMSMYAGREHWNGVYGFADNASIDRPIANSMFTALNTLEAQLMAKAPRALLFPRTRGNINAANTARVAQVVLNYYLQELDFKRQVNRAQKDAFFAPFGVIAHGYTPEEEHVDEKGRLLHFNGTSRPSAPWVRRKPIWDFRGDVFRGTLHPAEMSWCALRDWYTKDMIRRNPGTKRIASGDLEATRVMGEDFLPQSVDRADAEPDDYRELIEVWTIYDRIEKTWFQVSPGYKEYVVREPEPWPLEWDELPVSLISFNEQPADPFPIPYAQVLLPIQVERNKLRTMISLMTKSMKRIVVANPEMFEPESEAALKSGDLAAIEILLAKADPTNAIWQGQIGGPPQELFQWDAVMKEEIREVMGQSNMDRAQRINVESASEASFVQEGSATQKSRNQSTIEDHWKDVCQKFMQGLRTVADSRIIVPITGDIDIEALVQIQGDDVFGQSAEPFLDARKEDISANYLVQIEVGSTMPRSQREEVARAQAWIELGSKFPESFNMPAAFIDAAIAYGKNPARALASQALQQATQQLGQAQQEAGVPQAEGAPATGGGGGDMLQLLNGAGGT